MENIRIAMITCLCPAGDVRQNLDSTIDWAGQARAAGAALACFPEMNISGYGLDPGVYKKASDLFENIVKELSRLAAREKITVLAGTVRQDQPTGLFRPCHIVAFPGGETAIYEKLHIAPPETALFVPGNKVFVAGDQGCRFGLQLCYDAHFPELSTRLALLGADLLFMPHASPRGTAQEKYDSWMRHLTARAYDNGLFVAACNQSGDNGAGLAFPGVAVVIGPDGKVIDKRLGPDQMLVVDLAAADLAAVRNHRMRYFLPHRRPEIYRPD